MSPSALPSSGFIKPARLLALVQPPSSSPDTDADALQANANAAAAPGAVQTSGAAA